MITQRKLEANRRNAARSTGPRTAEGKARVSLNAVKHGMTGTTVVLPHEDEQAYQHRLEAWTAELRPPGELGRYLVERVVRISWQLDRADTYERARLVRRSQEAPRHLGTRHGHTEPAATLVCRLLGTDVEPAVQHPVDSHRPGGAAGQALSPPIRRRSCCVRWNPRPRAAGG